MSEKNTKQPPKSNKLDDEVLCFTTIEKVKVMMPIEGNSGRNIMRDDEFICIKVLDKDKTHKTKKLETKKYKDAIKWMNVK